MFFKSSRKRGANIEYKNGATIAKDPIIKPHRAYFWYLFGENAYKSPDIQRIMGKINK